MKKKVFSLGVIAVLIVMLFALTGCGNKENQERINGNVEDKIIKIISGDGTKIGDEIAIGNEHFYVISNNYGDIKALAKYNLDINGGNFVYKATGIQDENVVGMLGNGKAVGTIDFSTDNYWYKDDEGEIYTLYGREFPLQVYDNKCSLYKYVEEYETYLKGLGANIETSLMTFEEAKALGCNELPTGYTESNTTYYYCKNAPSWLTNTSFWLGTANNINNVWGLRGAGESSLLSADVPAENNMYGIRPVITIPASEIK